MFREALSSHSEYSGLGSSRCGRKFERLSNGKMREMLICLSVVAYVSSKFSLVDFLGYSVVVDDGIFAEFESFGLATD